MWRNQFIAEIIDDWMHHRCTTSPSPRAQSTRLEPGQAASTRLEPHCLHTYHLDMQRENNIKLTVAILTKQRSNPNTWNDHFKYAWAKWQWQTVWRSRGDPVRGWGALAKQMVSLISTSAEVLLWPTDLLSLTTLCSIPLLCRCCCWLCCHCTCYRATKLPVTFRPRNMKRQCWETGRRDRQALVW